MEQQGASRRLREAHAGADSCQDLCSCRGADAGAGLVGLVALWGTMLEWPKGLTPWEATRDGAVWEKLLPT